MSAVRWGNASTYAEIDLSTCTATLHVDGYDDITVSPITGLTGVSLDIDLDDIDCTTLDVSGAATIGSTLAVTGAITATGGVAGATTGAHNGTVGATTPAAGTFTTLTATGLATLTPQSDWMVRATIAVADTGAGGTDAALTLALTRADGTTAIASARQVLIVSNLTQYIIGQYVSTVTFSAATTGSIVASGNGWALVQTDATGAFACTVSDSADETVYFNAATPVGGVSSAAAGCVVIASNSDAATWSA